MLAIGRGFPSREELFHIGKAVVAVATYVYGGVVARQTCRGAETQPTNLQG